jgi:hypothetical protein
MILRDSLRNTGDTQEGVVYRIFDFVLHKKVVSQCNWHVHMRKEKGQIGGIIPFPLHHDGGVYVTGM